MARFSYTDARKKYIQNNDKFYCFCNVARGNTIMWGDRFYSGYMQRSILTAAIEKLLKSVSTEKIKASANVADPAKLLLSK